MFIFFVLILTEKKKQEVSTSLKNDFLLFIKKNALDIYLPILSYIAFLFNNKYAKLK